MAAKILSIATLPTRIVNLVHWLCTTDASTQTEHRKIYNTKGVDNTPQWAMRWVDLMLLSFAIRLLFVKNRNKKHWVAGGFLACNALALLASRGFDVPALSDLIVAMRVMAWSSALSLFCFFLSLFPK